MRATISGQASTFPVMASPPLVSQSAPDTAPASATLLGDSAAMLEVRGLIERFAPTRHSVSIRGPSGTGKELAARALHDASGRTGPFVAINCGALGEALAESVLFGHVRGSFTGATRDHPGAFLRASCGTLFLDEVAELRRTNQALLLRVLESGRVTPVGGGHEVDVQTRVVTATHRDLEAMVARGDFREDLYHRLEVLSIPMPALSERPSDIPGLVDHFARIAAGELGVSVELEPGAIEAARRFAWPGNVRQLRNAVTRAAVLGDGHIGAEALLPRPPLPSNGSPTSTACDVAVPRGSYRTMQRALLEQAVAEHGSIRRAATALGVPRSTLGAWLRRSEPSR